MEIIDKPPKLKWKDYKKWKDSYIYNIIQLQEYQNDLYIKFSSSFKSKVNLFYVIKDYKATTPNNIFSCGNGMVESRHFNDAILDFYHSKGLPLGFVQPILKNKQL